MSSILAVSIYLIIFGGGLIAYVLLGLSLYFLMQNGVELDLLNMKYRELNSWYGISFGKWKMLPKIDYVSIFKTTKKGRVRGIGANAAQFSIKIYQLNLFYHKNRHITLIESEDKKKVWDAGDNISKILNVRFHNATKE